MLQDISDQIQVDISGNKLLVNASPKKIAEIQEVVKQIDIPAIQIMLETRLIEVAADNEEQLGIDWSRLSKFTTILAENALDEKWLHALDVDTSPEKILKLNMSMIDDVAKTISEFMKEYRTEHAENRDNAPKVLFVVDSLGMLLTPTDVDQFNKGEMKGDLGRKPKALTALVRNCVNMFGSWNVGLMATNHTYASQDMFDPDDKISGGQGFIYASSIVVAMKKLKLKEDADGNKVTDVRGIRAACKVMKTRYAKPFESVQVKIPYETGMNPYSGLLDLFEKKGVIKQQGNRLKYVDSKGVETIEFRKNWTGDKLTKVMNDFANITDQETAEDGTDNG